jgi:hypothetical protein
MLGQPFLTGDEGATWNCEENEKSLHDTGSSAAGSANPGSAWLRGSG